MHDQVTKILPHLCLFDISQVNGRVLLMLAGVPLPQGSDNDDACDFGTVVQAAQALAASLGGAAGALESVCWTDGPFPGGALHVPSGRAWKLTMPPLPGPVLSPVGAGDAVAGGTFHAWLGLRSAPNSTSAATEATWDLDAAAGPAEKFKRDAAKPAGVAAFQFGLACGAASCLTAENSALDLTTALSLHAQINVEVFLA